MSTFKPLDGMRKKLHSTTGAYEGVVDQNGDAAFPAAALSASEVPALQSLVSPDGIPQRGFALGDSITNRQYQPLSTVTTTVSGSSLIFTSASAAVPVGAGVRVTNQTAIYDEVGTVTASGASGFTALFSRDLTGLVSGTCNLYIYSRGNDTGWLNYARGLLAQQGKPINIVANEAVGGAKVAEMLVRLRTKIIPRATLGDVLWFMGGINDVEVTDTSTTGAPNTIATIKTIFDEALAAGMVVHASTVTPAQASGYFAVASTGLAQIAAINGYIRARCAAEANAVCFDSWAAIQSGGSYAAAGLIETSGVHPLPAGAAAIGARYVTDCGSSIRKGKFRRWMSVADNYVDSTSWNLLTNCEFTGATGATPPTGWVTSGTSTTFTLSDGAVTGKDLSIAKASVAGNATILSQDITARVSAGDRLLFGTEQETVTIGQGHYLNCDLVFTVGGVEQIFGIGRQQFTVLLGGSLPPAGSRWFHEWVAGANDGRGGVVVPAGFTSALFRYTLRQDSVGVCEVKVARPHVYKAGSALA